MSAKKKAVPVVLFGVGGVGKDVINILECVRDGVATKLNIDIQLLAMVDSTAAVVADRYHIPDSLTSKILAEKSSGRSFRNFEDGQGFEVYRDGGDVPFVDALLERIGDLQQGVFVDCTADEKMVDVQITALGKHATWTVVLANKKPLTCETPKYQSLTKDPSRIRYESTVGAGLPVITSLTRIVNSGDKVGLIEGVFSGTLGYLCTALEEGKLFSEAVQDAKTKGFTEPDPRDDLNGLDVARKALILARLCGVVLELDQIQVESLYLESMKELSVDKFMKSLGDLDDDFSNRVEAASKRGKVLRYAARLVIEDSQAKITVGLNEVSATESPLGRLRGTDNIISIHSEIYDEEPLVIQGRGAGTRATAGGVVSDIFDLKIQ